MSEAVVIRFPVERRDTATVQQEGQTMRVGGSGNYSLVTAFASFEQTTFTGVGAPGIVVPSPPLAMDGLPLDASSVEPWWARVPGVEWAKIGFFPSVEARQHRLMEVTVKELGAALALIAFAACGRRGPLSERFDENVSGGFCRRCSRR